MILGRFGLCVFSAAVAALAAASPAVAADGEAKQGSKTVAPAARGGDQAAHSRRVELPFLLESAPPVEVPQAPATERDSGPHPFRDLLLKRAAFSVPGAGRSGYFS